MTYKIYWTNLWYTAPETFATIDAAIAHARSKCFCATIMVGATGEVVAIYDTISGSRRTT